MIDSRVDQDPPLQQEAVKIRLRMATRDRCPETINRPLNFVFNPAGDSLGLGHAEPLGASCEAIGMTWMLVLVVALFVIATRIAAGAALAFLRIRLPLQGGGGSE